MGGRQSGGRNLAGGAGGEEVTNPQISGDSRASEITD